MITKGWESTVLTLRKAASFPETTKFLISYFFYSDSYSTIGSIGVLVMQQHMCMPSFMIAVVLLEVLVFAAAGSMLAIRVQHTWRLEPKQMIFACLCGYVVLCLLGILGLVPGSPVGLKSVPEAFFFGALHGLLMGPVQSYSRTLFSDLIIPGQESEFFALYEITDKGSSWLGPLVAGELYRATGSIHAGFIYLLFMTILPAMLLLTVDHRKGVQEVQGLASSGTSLRSSKLQLSEQRLLEDEEGEEGHGGGGAGECEEGVGGVRGGLGCSVDGSTVAVSVAT
jgi:UMF1 family MFS transporter